MIQFMYRLFKKMLGVDHLLEEKIALKREEAHTIKNEMTKDFFRMKQKTDRINLKTNKKLNEIDKDLHSVTYRIAVATGGKSRGL